MVPLGCSYISSLVVIRKQQLEDGVDSCSLLPISSTTGSFLGHRAHSAEASADEQTRGIPSPRQAKEGPWTTGRH